MKQLYALILFPILAASAFAEGAAPPAHRLDGTFIQLTNANAAWPVDQWEGLFQRFRQIGLRQVIVQWSEYDDVRFDSVAADPPRPGPIDLILRLAAANDMQVLVGTVYDTQFWAKIAREPSLLDVYLRRLAQRTQQLAGRLGARLRASSAFVGWYISQEIDDSNWRDAEKQRRLAQFLRDVGKTLRNTTPRAAIAVSGFANGSMDVVAHARLWDTLLYGNKIDMLLFQDGVGANKLMVDEVPLYLEPLRQAARENDCELTLVIELFAAETGAHSAAGFRAAPAPIARISQQLDIAARYELRTIGFSVPDYMTAQAGAAGETLFQDYLTLTGGR